MGKLSDCSQDHAPKDNSMVIGPDPKECKVINNCHRGYAFTSGVFTHSVEVAGRQ